MKADCPVCKRTVQVLEGALIQHRRHKDSFSETPCSGSGRTLAQLRADLTIEFRSRFPSVKAILDDHRTLAQAEGLAVQPGGRADHDQATG